jgi:hypothetical protein
MPKPSKSYHLLGFGIKSTQILVTTAGFKPSAETLYFMGFPIVPVSYVDDL